MKSPQHLSCVGTTTYKWYIPAIPLMLKNETTILFVKNLSKSKTSGGRLGTLHVDHLLLFSANKQDAKLRFQAAIHFPRTRRINACSSMHCRFKWTRPKRNTIYTMYNACKLRKIALYFATSWNKMFLSLELRSTGTNQCFKQHADFSLGPEGRQWCMWGEGGVESFSAYTLRPWQFPCQQEHLKGGRKPQFRKIFLPMRKSFRKAGPHPPSFILQVDKATPQRL